MRKPRMLRAVFRRVQGEWVVASNVPLTTGTKVPVQRCGAESVSAEIGAPVPQAQLPRGVSYCYRVVDRSAWLVIGKHVAVVFARAALAPWSVIEARRGSRYQPVEIGGPLPSRLIPPGYTHGYRVTDLDPYLPGGRAPQPVPVPLYVTTDNHLGFAAGN